ncbi:dihydrofolate reductase family protein [Actinomadura nitritigenes]|uniref:dihydrofolate reductase family protein n=1 Tax=Actinomadura nitritigenes TaxID=134602 RepID=UPI003D936930
MNADHYEEGETVGRLVVSMQMSLDGCVGSDVAGSRWQLWDWGPDWPWTPDVRERFNELFASASGILLSRPMISEGYLDHWRGTAQQHPDDPDYAFAARIGRLPKVVVTRHALTTPWPGTTVITGDLAEAVRQAKQVTGGDLVCFGGAGFVAALLDHGLVDELQLYLNPGIAGHGPRIFGDALAAGRLTLLDATPTDCGIVITRWRPPDRHPEPVQGDR